ncbi:unnamed protein product [Colias eurytheme]|nr:unnamed protein product [Colias eurytheme]
MAKVYKKYTDEELQNALLKTRSGELTAYKASKLYKVPYQTLLDKLKNKHTNPAGHATVLTKDEEELIVKWVLHMADIGFPVSKEELLLSVGKLVRELNRANPFKDGIPGRDWYERFLKRNPTISM